jgi:predicted ATP-dependent endonuclease of OLD family
LDDNGQKFYEAGSGRTSVLHYLIEMKINISKGVRSFLFDEPENHMHPSLLRMFLKYLASKSDLQFFITTHSSILIDQSILDNSSTIFIFQIKKENGFSKVQNVTKNRKGLRDIVYQQLGYKPSDILFANTVIWVEGPSDVIYIRHWLNKKAPDLKEGHHYTFMFYGGSLIKHISFETDIDTKSLIELSRINNNSAIVIDSDKKNENQEIGSNKKKVKKEFLANNGFVWITTGREIENYIPQKTFVAAVKKKHPQLAKNYNLPSDEDNYYNRTSLNPKKDINKVGVAKIIIEKKHVSIDFGRMELDKTLTKLIDWIREK